MVLSSVLCDDLERWDGGSGREVQEAGDMCIGIDGSLCCTAETNTTLQSNHTLVFKKGHASVQGRRQWHPTPVLLPGKSHGRRSLVVCSPWGRDELERCERLHFHLSLSCSGEGNGNLLWSSSVENPRDGGAWRAAVYGVAQSRTRLK